MEVPGEICIYRGTCYGGRGGVTTELLDNWKAGQKIDVEGSKSKLQKFNSWLSDHFASHYKILHRIDIHRDIQVSV